jgi:hypothetical protein
VISSPGAARAAPVTAGEEASHLARPAVDPRHDLEGPTMDPLALALLLAPDLAHTIERAHRYEIAPTAGSGTRRPWRRRLLARR